MSEQDRAAIKSDIATLKTEVEREVGAATYNTGIDAFLDLLSRFFCDVNRIADASEAAVKHS